MTGERNGTGTRLDGQVAVVTGGGRGIGRALARALARAGAAVAVVARTAAQLDATVALIEAEHGRALALPADVTDRWAVDGAVAAAAERLGPVDLLVNNAGIFGPIGPTWEVDPDVWWSALESHLRGTLLCSRAVLPGMVARRRGRIINVASRSATRAQPYTSSYAAAKAALIRFTDSLAEETRAHRVSIFAIYPGIVRTRMTDALTDSPEGQRWRPETAREREGLWVSPRRAAELCLFLASGQGDALSGRFFGINDDIAALAARADEITRDDLYTLRLRT